MASTFTPNIQIEEPARGDDVGTWDTPVNNNSTLLDLVAGGTATITLNNANVVLSAAQFQCHTITFVSTLTGSVAITFPTSFKKPYTIQHTCTGSSAFTITLNTTAGGQVVACPPGQPFDMLNDGANIKFKNFGPHIGGYWDYAGSSVPNWVSGCTVPPYLNCDGSAFSAGTYPTLAVIMGGTTLPDMRGRSRFYLNQGTGRITSGGGGVDGNTLFAGGGNEFMQSHTHTANVSDPSHFHNTGAGPAGGGGGGANFIVAGFSGFATQAAFTGISVTNTSFGSGASQNMPPAAVGGLTLIRAG